jgi:hypothetical protein
MARQPTTRPDQWTPEERTVLATLDSPAAIQAFLDTTPYGTEPIYRCPRNVLRDRRAHCFDGAMFAAAALRRLDHPPLLVDLRAERDDDHVIAVFKRGGFWGAVAKSNFVGLRFREPIFRTLRELALSYFPNYYNLEYLMSLRAYSLPVDLAAFDRIHWETSDERLEEIATRLDRVRHFPLLNEEQRRLLVPTDERTFRGHMYGTDMAGVYDPAEKES